MCNYSKDHKLLSFPHSDVGVFGALEGLGPWKFESTDQLSCSFTLSVLIVSLVFVHSLRTSRRGQEESRGSVSLNDLHLPSIPAAFRASEHLLKCHCHVFLSHDMLIAQHQPVSQQQLHVWRWEAYSLLPHGCFQVTANPLKSSFLLLTAPFPAALTMQPTSVVV